MKSFFFPEESTDLLKAQFKLFYLMLGANVLKGLIYLYDAYHLHQGVGSGRALRLILTSILLIAALRAFPKLVKLGIHYAIIGTILHVYYRVFNDGIGSDTVAMQAIVMVLISSFYGLNARWGAFYSIIAAAAPILLHYFPFRFHGLNELPQDMNDLYIAINFLVIIISHVYFHRVLFKSLREKDKLNAQLTQTAERNREFLSTMAHELRTPLNSVIGIANLVIEDNENEAQKEQLDVMKFSAENLLSLINDVLDINKLSAGKVELEKIPFNCYTLITAITTGMQSQAKEKSLNLTIDVSAQVRKKSFEGDSTRISQVIYNLVGNAIKFTNSGGIKVEVSTLGYDEELEVIRFKVSDTGIGMTESQQEKIFDAYVQADADTTRKFGGTGLGLSIVKQLVERFGSTIHLQSKIGVGTTIYFDLKLKELAHDVALQAQPVVESKETLESIKVLLAEDNMVNVYFMKQLFQRWNVNFDVAENGQVAIQLLLTNTYDVILMDMHMPIMDGLEAAKQIRQLSDPLKANIPIIALTASVSDDARRSVEGSGMNDYLTKPFQLDELKNKLLHIVTQNRSGA